MPTYDDLLFRTHKNSPLTEVNGLFKLTTLSKSTFGGPTSIFFEPRLVENLINDLTKLHVRLVDLGVECKNGEVRLPDLEEVSNVPRIDSG